MPGDEEEDDTDDLENEFALEMGQLDEQNVTDAMLHGHMSYGGNYDHNLPNLHQTPQFPLLTDGKMVHCRPSDSSHPSGKHGHVCCRLLQKLHVLQKYMSLFLRCNIRLRYNYADC